MMLTEDERAERGIPIRPTAAARGLRYTEADYRECDLARAVADFDRVAEGFMGFNELDHPRDELGRFAAKHGGTMYTAKNRRTEVGYGAAMGALVGLPFAGVGALPGAVIGGAIGEYNYRYNRKRAKELNQGLEQAFAAGRTGTKLSLETRHNDPFEAIQYHADVRGAYAAGRKDRPRKRKKKVKESWNDRLHPRDELGRFARKVGSGLRKHGPPAVRRAARGARAGAAFTAGVGTGVIAGTINPFGYSGSSERFGSAVNAATGLGLAYATRAEVKDARKAKKKPNKDHFGYGMATGYGLMAAAPLALNAYGMLRGRKPSMRVATWRARRAAGSSAKTYVAPKGSYRPYVPPNRGHLLTREAGMTELERALADFNRVTEGLGQMPTAIRLAQKKKPGGWKRPDDPSIFRGQGKGTVEFKEEQHPRGPGGRFMKKTGSKHIATKPRQLEWRDGKASGMRQGGRAPMTNAQRRREQQRVVGNVKKGLVVTRDRGGAKYFYRPKSRTRTGSAQQD